MLLNSQPRRYLEMRNQGYNHSNMIIRLAGIHQKNTVVSCLFVIIIDDLRAHFSLQQNCRSGPSILQFNFTGRAAADHSSLYILRLFRPTSRPLKLFAQATTWH